jgi:hypothetical protein
MSRIQRHHQRDTRMLERCSPVRLRIPTCHNRANPIAFFSDCHLVTSHHKSQRPESGGDHQRSTPTVKRNAAVIRSTSIFAARLSVHNASLGWV